MPLKKSRITDRVVPVPFNLILRNEETGEVEEIPLRPKVRSLSYDRWGKWSSQGGENQEALATQLADVVEDLDVEDDGKPFVPTVENLRTMDAPVLSQYRDAILSFFMPQREALKMKKETIENGLPLAANSEASPQTSSLSN